MNKAKLRTIDAWTRGPGGMLPNFVVLGAQKCGTSSIFDFLMLSKEVAPPATKEIMYFDKYFHKGLLWYKAHFPRKSQKVRTGEASPEYIYFRHAPVNAKKILQPDTKFLVLLRNPILRAYSQYKHEVRKGCETLGFEEALAAEDERMEEGRKIFEKDPRRLHNLRHFSYKSRGLYAEQLENWFQHFERKQFLVIRTEDLAEKPEEIREEIVTFLDLPDLRDHPIPKSNVGGYGDSIKPETLRELQQFFAEPNARLNALLGRDMNW